MKRKLSAILLLGLMIILCAWSTKKETFEISKDTKVYALTTSTNVNDIYDVSKQKEIESEIQSMKLKASYSETSPLLIYNPYGTNTTSMYAYFITDEETKVSYTIHVDNKEIEDFTQTLDNDYILEHEYQILGLIPDTTNTITFTLEKKDGTVTSYDYTYQMGSLLGEENLQLDKEEGISTETVADGLYVVLGNDSDKQDFMYYYDNNGILRGEIPIKGYRSHRLLFQDDTMYFSISEEEMVSMNNLGQVTNVYDLNDYTLHHDYVFDDDGNILILATDSTSDTVEDQIIRLNIETGKVTTTLDLGDLFHNYKKTTAKNADGDWDWMHINTIQWMGDDSILLSSRETSTIIKIANFSSNPTVSYMLGDKTFWEDTSYSNLLFDKDGSFSSQAGQHSITYVEDDSLADGQYYLYMFNNNFGYSETNKDFDWSSLTGIITDYADKNAASKYYKYLVDENKKTYKLVDSFDVPFSAYVSSVQDLESTTIVDSGNKKNFQEYDSNHTLIQSFSIDQNTFVYRVYKYTFEGFYFSK